MSCGSHRDLPNKSPGNPYESGFFADVNAEVLHPGGLALTRHLVDCCAWPAGARIVDLGCGTGLTVELLQDQLGFRATGVDISAILIRQAKRRRPEIPLFQATAACLPFDDASVDGILAECALSEFGDPEAIWAEMRRVLVPGGKIGIADLYLRQPGSADGLRQKLGPGAGCIARALTESEWLQLLEKHGFALRIWEDRLADWKDFVARLVMTFGSMEAFWQKYAPAAATAGEMPEKVKLARVSYFCLVAQKIG